MEYHSEPEDVATATRRKSQSNLKWNITPSFRFGDGLGCRERSQSNLKWNITPRVYEFGGVSLPMVAVQPKMEYHSEMKELGPDEDGDCRSPT